jgi:hypothetical protein
VRKSSSNGTSAIIATAISETIAVIRQRSSAIASGSATTM